MAMRDSMDCSSLNISLECNSIAASTEEILWSDDDTIVNDQENVWHEDLAAIRRLLESENTSGICPSCDMPFDKGKKRRLIDTCGHERCYSCMFHNEGCPLCQNNSYSINNGKMGCSGLRGSEITLYGDISPQLQQDSNVSYDRPQSRTKVKTNGHFTTFMQSRQDLAPSGNDWAPPARLPKTRPSNPRTRLDHGVMTQSCPTPPQSRRRFFLSPKAIRSPFANRSSSGRQDSSVAISDDEGGTIKPVAAPKSTKSTQNDLYMRLGLLLGDGARRSRKPPPPIRNSHESCSSLASCDTAAALSTNTSPVSTLTGSSEDQHRNNPPSSESVGSLMSMSMSGQSNCSSSPVSRRHSVTTTQGGQVEDLGMFKSRRTCIRRSARTGTVKGPVDPKIRFAQYRAPQLTLKPLFFEVPLQEPDPLFLGRHWLIKEVEELVDSSSPGVLLTGNPGTGKTALILQLVEYSCFGRRKEPLYQSDSISIHSPDRSPMGSQSIYCQINLVSERIRHLSSKVVAYHFCQADNNNTCLVPDFIHSLAAQLCQAPQLAAYRDYLLSEPHLQGAVSMKECIADPDLAFNRGILEPLSSLRRVGKIENQNCVILVDALCEAEYHRPDHGDTITSFLAKHTPSFPSWLKVVCTVRAQLHEITKQLPYTRICLDKLNSNDNLQKDLLDYVNFRLNNSPSIQSNITLSTTGKIESGATCQYRFGQHMMSLCKGSFLFAKLTLDLLERGHLVAKSSGYKVLPVSLAQIYLLHFNLRFPTVRSFEKVSHVLSVCLSALYPLTLLEIYYSVNSLLVDNFLPWEEFLQRFKLLSGFLVKRLDNTYMFFHPSFREWLIRRDEGESTKFMCDLRAGHAGIAFRLSRVQAPLDPEKTLELGHHILKAHVYRNMTGQSISSRDLQANWVAQSSENVSAAICTLRNIYSPNVKVSRLLLLAGGSPDYVTEFLGNAPALCLYSNEGIVPMVSLLLEFGANVELANSQGSTALSLASAKGHCDVVRQLIAAGASLGHADTSGHCPLVHAARNGWFSVVGYLLACDWLAQTPEDVGLAEAAQQALVAASGQGHTEIVEYLLDMAEVNVDTPDSLTGETALTVAAANGCQTVVSALIGRGADVSVSNRKEMTPLLLAVKEGHWAVVERLLQNQAALEQCDSVGRSALMLASSEGHVGVIELLLDKGAAMERKDQEGLTPLCWSCLRGKMQATQCLLDRGANINHNDKTGRTPLDLAAFQGNPVLVQLLLERGAVIEHVDINGMRPLDRAIACRNIQVVQCFLRKGAKLGPATWAMAAGKPEIMLILLNKLLEDGNILYRKSRLREAAHRYQYALKKFPNEDLGEHNATFHQLRINFLLNQSRCKRKMNAPDEAIELANQVLSVKPEAYEAFYARAKARADLRMYEAALSDVREALRLAPTQNMEVRKVLVYLKEDIGDKLNQSSTGSIAGGSSSAKLTTHRDFAISVDTLHENASESCASSPVTTSGAALDPEETAEVDNLEDARKLIQSLRHRYRAQAHQLMAWKRAYKKKEDLVFCLQREKDEQLKFLSSKMLLLESRLIRKQKDISARLIHRENIIYRQQQVIDTLTNRLNDNGLESQTDLEIESNLLELDSLNDSDSAVVMEDIDSDSNISHIPRYRTINGDTVTVVRSISDAIDPNLKYTSVRRSNGYLRRPEILETVYSVEEDGDGEGGAGGNNENKPNANQKRDAFASSKSAVVEGTVGPQEGVPNEGACEDKVFEVPTWPFGQERLSKENEEAPPEQKSSGNTQGNRNQVTTYNRVMSNHRSVTKPKDVKYKRINKAKSKSLEELRGRLKNWVEQGSKLTGLSLDHSQSYA